MDSSCCKTCSLSGKPQVKPTGNPLSPLWFIGEAPETEDESQGIPFCGTSGSDHWRILRRHKVSREQCRVFNVLRCRPPDNDDPTPEQIAACRPCFDAELAQARPGTIIVTLGRFALHALLPGAELAKIHGIPQKFGDKIILPAYHPAAGLHQPNILVHYQEDMRAAVEILEGRRSRVHEMREPIAYETSESSAHLQEYLSLHSGLLSMDTELYADGSLYLISLSVLPDLSYVFDVRNRKMWQALQNFIYQREVEITFHNSLVDIPWSGLDFEGQTIHDTMLMAHILQSQPLKLKHLAYRLLGLHIDNYPSIVDPVTRELLLIHLGRCLADPAYKWPTLPKGSRRRAPWKRVATVLRAMVGGLDIRSVVGRWGKILEDYPAVGELCGSLPAADLSYISKDRAYSYTAQDAGSTYQIHHILMAQLMELGLLSTYQTDMQALPMVVDMNRSKCPVNRAGLLALGDLLDRQLAEVRDRLPYNPMSGDQVAEMLKSKGLDTRKRTKAGKMSTGKKALTLLKDRCAEVATVLEYREDLKLRSAYVTGILEVLQLQKDGTWTLTPNISMTRVPTGRLAASRPNIMAMPYRTDQGTAIRYAFYAPEGCTLLSLDYSSIELRVLAHHSQDDTLLEVFRQGLDPHGMTASRLFGVPVAEVHPKLQRYPAKTVIFLIVYGGGPSKLKEELATAKLKWSYTQCSSTIEDVKHKVYPGVGAFLDWEAAHIRRTGESRDMAGRRRLIPQIYSTLPYIQEEGIRQGINNIIQSGAQSIIKRAMGEINPICHDFQRQGYICDPFTQVHDELIFTISNELVGIIPNIFKEIMIQCGTGLSVPLEVDYATGRTWGEIS